MVSQRPGNGIGLSTVQLIELGREREFTDRFVDALGYAARVHAGQHNPGDGQPYIAHLLRVAGLVIEDGGSENEAIAALLHDAAEDQGGLDRLSEIRQRYGEEVARVVNECTDTYLEQKPPWRARKERYVAHLADSSSAALRVSLADKLDNARTALRDYRVQGEELWSRSGRRGEDVCWYYAALAERFADLQAGPLSDELGRVATELRRLVGDSRRAAIRCAT